MKLLTSIFITALLAFAFGLYMPWWTIAVSAFIVAVLIHQPPARSFLSGFLGIFILWLALSWYIDVANDGILASRIAVLLPLGGSVFMLIFVTAIVGALVGGLGALTGCLLRKLSQNGRIA
jgi:small-conductance mechanosensitive channel